jgi:hypothetical protein
MTLTRKLKYFLSNLIKSTQNDKELKNATLAIKILERGYITERELSYCQSIGYKG